MKMGLFLNFDKSGILDNFSRNKAIFTFNVNILWSMEGSADEFGDISGYTDESIVAQRMAGNPRVKDESGAPWILTIASDIEGFIIKSYSDNTGKFLDQGGELCLRM